MMNQKFITLLSLIIFTAQIFGQSLTDKNIELPSDWNSEIDTYIARDYIRLNPGFSFSGTTNALYLEIDENLIYTTDYIDETDIVNPTGRSLDKTLPVGSTNGSFNVSGNGAAVYSIPIAVSPGTAGMQPRVSVSYNSMGSRGLLGYGWTLSGISAITRTKKDLYHDNTLKEITLDNNDVFALDGQRLIKVSGGEYGANGTVYGKTFEDFSRITSYGDVGGGPEYFIVEAKDGTKLYYGNAESEANANRTHNLSSVVISWYLYKVEDIHGNYMLYNYSTDPSIGEILLKSIKYTGNETLGITPFNEIKIFYDTRSDIDDYYIGNCKFTNNKIIRSIKTYCKGNLFRKYEPTYFYDTFTYLNEFQEYNAQGESFNSLVFGIENKTTPTGWQNLHTYENRHLQAFADFTGDGVPDLCELVEASNKTDYEIVISTYNSITNTYEKIDNGGDLNTPGFKNTEIIYPGDFNGDGLSDLICVIRDGLEYKIILYLNTNGVIWPQLSNTPTTTVNTTSIVPEEGDYPRYYVNDYNGDNISDLLVYFPTNRTNWFYLGNDTGELFNTKLSKLIKGYLEDAEFTDFNGDGRADILYKTDNGNRIINILSDGSSEELAIIEDLTSEYIPMDLNGDNRSELVKIYAGKITSILEYTPSGFNSVEVPNYFVDYSSAYKANSFDITGDGKEELILSGNDGTKNTIEVLSFQGNQFVQLAKKANLTFRPIRILPVDYDGNGIQDVSFIDNKSLYVSDLGLFLKPRKVNRIANGLNQTVEINYGFSSDNSFCSHSTESSYPVINLPFSLMLVKDYSIENGIGGKTRFDYSYSDPKIHIRGMGFFGFMSHTVLNSATGILSTNGFEINEDYNIPGIFTNIVTTNSGDTISKNRQTANFNHIDADLIRIYRTVENSAQNDYLKGTYISTNYTWDNYGNVTNYLTDYNGEGTVSQSINYSNHGTNFPAHPDDYTVSVTLLHEPEYIRTRNFIYNGLELEQIVNDPGDAKEITTSFQYYLTGSLKRKEVSASDVSSQYEEYTYDNSFRFPKTKTVTGEYVTSFAYDETNGNLLSSTDIYGTTTLNFYDNWGGLTGSYNPISGNKTISKDWSDGNQGNDFIMVTTAGDQIPTSVVYKDILGRSILQQTQKYEGDNVFVKYEYNDDGTLYRTSQPYESSVSQWNTYTYDDFGRIIQEVGLGYDKSYTYSGLTNIITNNITGNQKTTVMNGVGLVDNITDPGGNISYSYYSSGKIKEITSPDGITSFEYDLQGNRTTTVSLNAGTSTVLYNSLGQQVTATNAKMQTTSYFYDSYGRLDYFVDLDGTTDYTYVLSGNGLGQLESITGPDGHTISYSYDSYGRSIGYTETIDGTNYPFSYNYDNLGRLESMEYPSGFSVDYNYNNRGFIESISNESSTIWALNETNVWGKITNFDLGNGLSTTRSYNDMGQITDIETGTVQDLRYTYNTKNLMEYRFDDLNGLSENFVYDNLNRLSTYTVAGYNSFSVNYEPNGNIESKSDIGAYLYNDSEHPNAVTNISTSSEVIPSTSQNITYNHFNKVIAISEDLLSLNIEYGIDGLRRKTTLLNNGSTEKTKIFVGPYEKEILSDGTVRELHYINAPSGIAAIYELTNGTSGEMYYIHTDHLGSFDKITDAAGTVVEEYSFDPWGRRRNPDNWSYDNMPTSYLFDRGYTGHQHLDEFDLINMNGRVYDPKLARFLSPDPFIQAPGYTQNYNSYTYCFNNPLLFTDPSGFKSYYEEIYDDINNDAQKDMNARGSGAFDGSGVNHFGAHGAEYDFSSGRYIDKATGQEVSFETAYAMNSEIYNREENIEFENTSTNGSNSILEVISLSNNIIEAFENVDAKDFAQVNVFLIFKNGTTDLSIIFNNTGKGLKLVTTNYGKTPTKYFYYSNITTNDANGGGESSKIFPGWNGWKPFLKDLSSMGDLPNSYINKNGDKVDIVNCTVANNPVAWLISMGSISKVSEGLVVTRGASRGTLITSNFYRDLGIRGWTGTKLWTPLGAAHRWETFFGRWTATTLTPSYIYTEYFKDKKNEE